MLNKFELQQVVDEVLKRLFSLSEASEDATDGVGLSEGIDGENRTLTHGALPGFSSGIVGDDELLMLRRKDGGFSLISTEHCPGEQAGDRNLWTSDELITRLRGLIFSVLDSGTGDADPRFTVNENVPTVANPANPVAVTLLPVARNGDGIMLGGSVFPNSIVATTLETKSH